MERELLQVVRKLFDLEKKVESLRSSCKWGREEIEDIEFFRRYITKGNTSFLSQYNGYKRLKPFVYSLYQSPNSPSLIDSDCLKSFSFSSLKIAWSEYLSKSKAKRSSSLVEESYDFRRFYENLSDKDLEIVVKELYERSSKNPKLRSLGQLLEAMSLIVLFREVFSKHISQSILSKGQSEAVEKIVEVLDKRLDEVKKSLFSEIDKSKEELSIEGVDIESVKNDKDFDKVVAREYFVRNRGRIDKNKVEALVKEVKRLASGQDRQSIEDILDSAKQFFTSPGQVKFEDIPKILGGAEAISLARRVFRYLNRLEEVAKEIEEENRKLQRIYSSPKKDKEPNGSNVSNEDEKNGGRTTNPRSPQVNRNDGEKPPLSQGDRKRLEEFFRGVLLELNILYELLDFLTKKHRGFEKFKRSLAKTFKRISDAIKSIAEKLGLKRLLTPEGIVSLLSELALQLT